MAGVPGRSAATPAEGDHSEVRGGATAQAPRRGRLAGGGGERDAVVRSAAAAGHGRVPRDGAARADPATRGGAARAAADAAGPGPRRARGPGCGAGQAGDGGVLAEDEG